VFLGPNLRKAHHHFGLVNAVDRHAPDFGKGIVTQGIDPLLAVFGIFSHGHPVNVSLLRHLFEGWHLSTGVKTRVQPLFSHTAIF